MSASGVRFVVRRFVVPVLLLCLATVGWSAGPARALTSGQSVSLPAGSTSVTAATASVRGAGRATHGTPARSSAAQRLTTAPEITPVAVAAAVPSWDAPLLPAGLTRPYPPTRGPPAVSGPAEPRAPPGTGRL